MSCRSHSESHKEFPPFMSLQKLSGGQLVVRMESSIKQLTENRNIVSFIRQKGLFASTIWREILEHHAVPTTVVMLMMMGNESGFFFLCRTVDVH